jgi:4a-hydroxytetrahydrobiopterin dehydratase
MVEKLTEAARAKVIPGLTEAGWTPVAGRDAIYKRFEFPDFKSAFQFMTRAARWAEKNNHHPEWTNVYRIVDVTLTTHSAHGLSDLDVKLARKLDRLVAADDAETRGS